MMNWSQQGGVSRTQAGWWTEAAPRTAPLACFGEFEVDLQAGELRRRGLRIRVQSQPFVVLSALLEHSGQVVTREELKKALWSEDTFVDFEHGLNKVINKIREALDDSAENPRFVETLPRRGYRFIAPVVWRCKPFGEDWRSRATLPTLSPRAMARHLKTSLYAAASVLMTAFRVAIRGF